MLDKYKYLNMDKLKENVNFTKPDPKGSKDIYASKSYKTEFDKILNEAMAKVKKEAAEVMAKKLKSDLQGKLISMYDENGKQKILEVNDVIVENKGIEHYPVIVEDDKKKIKYAWEKDASSKISDLGKFLDFFEKHYLNQYISFQGKPLKGGSEMRYRKHVVRIGINESSQDFLIVECDDKTSQILLHTQPIKIMDMKLKEIDPHGEENWEN